MNRFNGLGYAFLMAMLLVSVGCGDESASSGADMAMDGAETGTDGTATDPDGTPSASADYQLNCEALASLFKTNATETVSDWTGFWQCYQETNGCSGESCTFTPEDLPDYVLGDDCASASSCTIGGTPVNECTLTSNTGYVDVDCSTDGAIIITVNGLPDHAFENYSSSGSIPPLLGSAITEQIFTFSNTPAFLSPGEEPSIFDSAGGSYGLAANGVSIFNQFTGLGSVAVTDEIVDDCGGHPANNTYHYHAYPLCGWLTDDERAGDAERHSGFMGLWFDGFPVLGPYGFDDPTDGNSAIVRLESCYTLSACDDPTTVSCYAFDQDRYDSGACHLDKCNGRETVTPEPLQDALGDRMYVYYMTLDADGGPAFPYLPFCYQGDVISGSGGAGGGGMSGPPPGGGPPPGN